VLQVPVLDGDGLGLSWLTINEAYKLFFSDEYGVGGADLLV